MDGWSLCRVSLLALFFDHTNFFIEQLFVVQVQVTGDLVICTAVSGALYLELVLITKF